jgi:hypothetical protein
VDPDGNEIKKPKNKSNGNNNKGPQKGEVTSGNQSRIGRNGDPRDED